MTSAPPPVIAAFDFDCTITDRDTLYPFLLFTTGRFPAYWKILKAVPKATGALFKQNHRQYIKEEFLEEFFSGRSVEEMWKLGKAYAQGPLLNYIKPAAMKQIQWHKEQGHQCILISASLDIYLYPWSASAGFDHAICSSLSFDSAGYITGHLHGLNCRGPEKVRRLLELTGPKENFILYAYGDSAGDRELLALADHPYYRKF